MPWQEKCSNTGTVVWTWQEKPILTSPAAGGEFKQLIPDNPSCDLLMVKDGEPKWANPKEEIKMAKATPIYLNIASGKLQMMPTYICPDCGTDIVHINGNKRCTPCEIKQSIVDFTAQMNERWSQDSFAGLVKNTEILKKEQTGEFQRYRQYLGVWTLFFLTIGICSLGLWEAYPIAINVIFGIYDLPVNFVGLMGLTHILVGYIMAKMVWGGMKSFEDSEV